MNVKLSSKSIDAFLSLVRAGLWENNVSFGQYGDVDFKTIYRLSEEQSVIGLVAAGIEHLIDIQVPQDSTFMFVSHTLQIEKRNLAMNEFVSQLIEQMRNEGIFSLLIKGQGIAQCYNRPLWRACGDVDLLFDEKNYQFAKLFLSPQANHIDEECLLNHHYSMVIKGWSVELHGMLHSSLGRKYNKTIDTIQNTIFSEGKVREWKNGNTQVFLPAVDEDIIFVFSHILQHFYKGGIGLRQICDLCRLLWTYQDCINTNLLERRINEMGVMAEWKSFASLSVNVLGMPLEAMPFYSHSQKWTRKANKLLSLVLEAGNFGHNRDSSYINNSPYLIRKIKSLWRYTKDSLRHVALFPYHAIIVWSNILRQGFKTVLRGR